MRFFKNMSIRNKLIFISLIPVLGLLYYAQDRVRKELYTKKAAEQIKLDVTAVEKLTLVIHELQKERALSVIYVSSGAYRSNETLLNQREFTDKAISSLHQQLTGQNRKISNMWLLDSLSSLRMKINNFKYNERDNLLFEHGKTLMVDEVGKIFRSSESQTLKNIFEDHLFLLYAKDYLGLLRGGLSNAIIEGKFTRESYSAFAQNKGKYSVNLNNLERLASPQLHDFFVRKFQGPFIQQMNACLDSALKDADLKNLTCTAESWYSAATASINILKEIEDFSSELIRQRAGAEADAAAANARRAILIAVMLLVFIILAVALTVKDIVESITKLKRAADQIAEGDVQVALEINSTDEIGKLGASFSRMINVTKQYSQIADTIGKGDYSPVINVRGPDDILGNALESMRSNLQKLSHESYIRNWLLTGNAELNDKMRGEKEVKELAQEVIIHLCAYMKAQIGAIYLQEGGQLDLVGSYAFQFRKNNSSTFKPGQGLVGQSALEKKPIVFSEIPENYIKINSGLGNAAPRTIIVFPFQYEGEVKGVLEIGASREFSELDIQFLEMVSDNIAISFNAAQSRFKLKELLEETQRQAEELEAQQEELKQANEELLEKTRLLEKSEAELKTQQEELQQTNEELEEKANMLEVQKDRLEVTKMEIENKARELEVVSKYKSEFLANMSHELRTPLNSILILAQLLAENKNNALREKEKEFAKNIYSSGTDLLNLINEILDLSKVESGKMELDIDNFAFTELINDLKSMFGEIAGAKAISFDIALEDSLRTGFITTDKLRLEQILRNLLSNAFKFTDRGGRVSLHIKRALKMPSQRPVQGMSHEVIAFEVKDNGIGIPFEKQAIIFEAFQQADGSTKRKYGGTGLGLSICRELSRVLGGEIQLESQAGSGSTFTLYLPLSFGGFRSAEVSDSETKIESPRHQQPLTIATSHPSEAETEVLDDRYGVHENDKVVLIVEDDPAFARLLLGFIRDRHYKGIVAHSGNYALSYARNYKPDAIILDMKLPVMSGTEVLKQLKSDPALRHIPVQIISGFDMRRQGLELGAFDYVKKPISKDDFQAAFDKIEDFINRKLKKLLIVEDNELQNKAIRELVGNGDVKCFSSYSGQEAYEILKREKFDCTIVDLGLPDMSGFELLEKIKNDEQLNKIPMIVYTGKDLTREENNRLSKLANTVVLKTVDSQERLLDETSLFLHRIESKLPKEKQNIIRRLHRTDEVLKNKNVLIVDDDIRNIYSLTNVLEEEGMNCMVAENGRAALKALEENRPVHIVLMDVMMPEMDGYEATREIRKIPKLGKLPVIALTAKAMKGDREKCLAAGMSDYISKPVDIDQLLSLMRVWLYQ